MISVSQGIEKTLGTLQPQRN